MSFTFRPAVRENIPTIVGIAGPTKSGKTMSAHYLAKGMANGGKVVMINAEGPKGHLYADRFDYVACDIDAPYSYERFTEAVKEAAKLNPAVLIIDSASHMHDGPGGLLEFHEAELDRIAGNDWKKRERATWTAWIHPKADENEFIYTLLGLKCHVILCFRAKEKLKIERGKEPVNLGWQPIAGDRITFETLFTLVLPPHSKGVPDLDNSEMREPFGKMFTPGRAIDEAVGRKIAEFAAGGNAPIKQEVEREVDPLPARAPSDEPPISQFWKDVRAAGFKREDVVQILGHERFEELDDDQLQEILFQLKDRKQGQLV